MRTLIFLLCLVCSVYALTGQSDTVTVWRYADLTYPLGGFNTKSKVSVDFGESSGWLKPQEQLEGADGKAVKFNSPVDALNWMSARGWELVQSYMTEEGAGLGVKLDYIHFVMRRLEPRKRE